MWDAAFRQQVGHRGVYIQLAGKKCGAFRGLGKQKDPITGNHDVFVKTAKVVRQGGGWGAHSLQPLELYACQE